MSDMVRRLMGQQRRRLVASALTSSEQSTWWSKLDAREQREYKDMLQRHIGVYHDFMLDVVQVGGEDELRSDRALIVLDQINMGVKQMQAAAVRG